MQLFRQGLNLYWIALKFKILMTSCLTPLVQKSSWVDTPLKLYFCNKARLPFATNIYLVRQLPPCQSHYQWTCINYVCMNTDWAILSTDDLPLKEKINISIMLPTFLIGNLTNKRELVIVFAMVKETRNFLKLCINLFEFL